MFGWIERIFHWGVVNIGGTVIGWVRDIIHGLYGFLHSVFGAVADGWSDFWKDANSLWNAAGRFGRAVYDAFVYVIRVLIPGVLNWARRELHFLRRWADYIWRWAVSRVEWLVRKLEQAIADIIRWVIVHIWQPLTENILDVWHWITTDGAMVVYYITHPDKLIDLVWDALIDKIEQEAWNLGKQLGNFFLGLVLANVKRFALLIEDIIVSLI